jgi:hypothetical protein
LSRASSRARVPDIRHATPSDLEGVRSSVASTDPIHTSVPRHPPGGGVVVPFRRTTIATLVVLSLLATLLVQVWMGERASAYPASLNPAQGAYLGSWVDPRGGEGAHDAIRRVEGQIGRKFDIDHRYYGWNAQIPSAVQRWDVDNGRIPFVNWLAGSRWSAISSGSQDAWIRSRADAFRNFAAPIYLTFHHEPEDDLGGYGSPSEFAAAFRHIVGIFRDRGANNVAFVWTMMSWTFNPGSGLPLNDYYPGDDYVDFVGSDGYNWYPGRSGSQWVPFQQIFQPTQDFAVAHAKPWIAVEYGVQEDPAQQGRKGQWFRDALQTAKGWPSLKGLIYFDEHKAYNWLTDSSDSSMAGYRDLALDPYMQQQAGGIIPGPTPTPTPTPTPSPPPSQPPGGSPPVVKNGLNAGPEGAPIGARAGRGGATPFDTVSTTRGASLTYDGTHARGRFSAKHVLNTRSDAYYQWDGTRTRWYGRILVWFDAVPAGDLRLVRASSADGLRCSMNIRPTGQVGFQDRENQWVVQSQMAIPVGRWVRIEWKVDHRTGRVKIKIFARAGSQKASEVLRAGPRLDIGSSADYFQFGRSGSNDFPITFWTDSPVLSKRGFPGPDAASRAGVR